MSSQTKSIQVGGQSDASGSGDDLLTIEAIYIIWWKFN